MECIVCLEPFDRDEHRPKMLPCGHSLCLQCLLNPSFGRKCPSDQTTFVGEPAKLADNFAVLNILEPGKPSSAAAPPPPDPVCCLTCRGPLTEECAPRRHTPCSTEELRQLHAEEVALVDQRLERGAVALEQSVRQLEMQQMQLSQRVTLGQQAEFSQRFTLGQQMQLSQRITVGQQVQLSQHLTLQQHNTRGRSLGAAQLDHGVGKALQAVAPGSQQILCIRNGHITVYNNFNC